MAQGEDQVLELQFRLGQVLQEKMGDTRAAVDAFRDILATNPEHGPSTTALEMMLDEGHHQAAIAEILEPLYRVKERWEPLVRIMEVQLAHMQDRFDRVQAMQRIAEICEQRMGEQGRAFEWWGHAFAEDPLSEVAAGELERLGREAGAWEPLAQVYAGVVQRLEPQERKPVLILLARVCEEELGDYARAEEAFLQVLQIHDMDPDALAALDRVYTHTSTFGALAEILKRRIAVTDSTDELVELQLRLGETFDMALDNPDAAVEAYTSVLEADSRNPRALVALESTYFKAERWPELFDVYERMIDIAPGDAGVADCYAHMAKISSDALGDPERALDLWSRVLDLRGEDPVALWALADLYETAQDFQELVEVMHRQVRITSDPHAQIRLFKRLGRIYTQYLGRDRNALESWARVLEIDPGDTESLYAMGEIYRRTEAWDELSQSLARLIDLGNATEMPQEELADLYTHMAQLKGEVMGDPEGAIAAWRSVVQIRPFDARALDALEQLLTRLERWGEVIQVVMHRVGLTQDAGTKVALLLQAGALWREKVGNLEKAVETYQQVLEADPSHVGAFQALRELMRETQRWEELRDLLMMRAEQEEDTARLVEVLQEMASVLEKHMGSAGDAFDVLQLAFSKDYTNEETAANFERLARATGKWNELLAEYYEVVQTMSDPEVKADLLVQMGKWYGKELGNMEYATAYLKQAIQLNPNGVRAMAVLEDFHRQAGEWDELLTVMVKHAELEQDSEKKTALYLSLAELHETQMEDQGAAIKAYREALRVDPGSVDALGALERLYRVGEQWESLIEILNIKARASEETEAVVDLWRRIGELYAERLQDPRQAMDAYRQVLQVDSAHKHAMRALELLYDQAGDTDAYLGMLEQQLDLAESDQERVSLLQRMATAYEEKYKRLDRAAECLEKVLEVDAHHEATYRALERLYQQSGRFTELVDTLVRHIGAVSDPAARVELYLAMGQVHEISLQDLDRAIDAYQDVLSFDQNHTQALDALARLFERVEAWDRAADAMQRLTELVDDPAYKTDIFFRLGKIFEEQLLDPATAERHYVQALALDSAHVPAMARLIEQYKARGDWAKAASMMVRAEQHSTNDLEKAKLLYEAGMAFLTQLDDKDQGVELLARCLQVDPDHTGAGEPLADIYYEGRGGADPRHAGAQGRPSGRGPAPVALLQAGPHGRRPGQDGQGAQVLPPGLRHRLHPPGDAQRHG